MPRAQTRLPTQFAKIFSDVCLGKFGHLDKINDWAAGQNLLPITNPRALAVFAGRPNADGKMVSVAGGGVPGSGKAWAVHDDSGHFVLATRLDPESCVLWAQKAESGRRRDGLREDGRNCIDAWDGREAHRGQECRHTRREGAHSRLSRLGGIGAQQSCFGDGGRQPFRRAVPGDARSATCRRS